MADDIAPVDPAEVAAAVVEPADPAVDRAATAEVEPEPAPEAAPVANSLPHTPEGLIEEVKRIVGEFERDVQNHIMHSLRQHFGG